MLRLLLAFLLVVPAWAQKPPATRTGNVKETIHGVTIADPYRWLEDQNSPETRKWIEAQNAYTRSVLDKIPGRQRLKDQLSRLMKIDQTGMPYERGGRLFFMRRLASQDQAVLYMRAAGGGRDEVLVDPNPMSPDHTTSVSLLDVSFDGKLIAYGIRQGGEDETTVTFLNVDTRKELADRMPRGRYSISIKPDRTGFFYSRYERDGTTRLYYHAFGKPAASDPQIFGKDYGPECSIDGYVTDNGRYLIVQVTRGSAEDETELWMQNLASNGPIVPIVRGIKAAFIGRPAGDTLFIRSNWEAPNWRIFAIDLRNPSWDRRREIIHAGTGVLTGFAAAGGQLFATYLENVSSKLVTFTPEGKRIREVAMPEAIGSVGDVSGDWTSRQVFFSFNSFNVPMTIFRYDPATGRKDVWWRADVPIDPAAFEVKQVWYASKDGTKIPMFLLYKKGLKLDGTNPVYLTGYGGFNVSLTPAFSPLAMLWAGNGGVFAQPNLRGGGEFGESWHKAGMLAKKQNVFDDFIGAAEWLMANKYTSPAKLAIAGGSNGGLLVGAALTQRPDLFRAVVCSFPLLDMIRYQKFLVARFWVPEYGSSEDPNQFKTLYAYSPYHHVKRGVKYPAVMFISGDFDTRVAPLHARKMAALLQASTGSGLPVLLHYDTKSGHSRGLPIGKQIDDAVDSLSFLYWQLGVAK
jgi:prolyl oligopeptidase